MDLNARKEELKNRAMTVTKELKEAMAFIERKQEEAVRIDAQMALLDQLIADEKAEPKKEENKCDERHEDK